ncbi:MAG: hypothetical protein ACFE9I_02275 [Candidatus Hermodarchaeota archaeon]
MKIIEFFRSRIILFIIQVLLLSLLIYSIGYKYDISFDVETSKEQKLIIQFLADYIFFDNIFGLFFIYLCWIIVSLIPIFVYFDFKKAYSMNIMTYFFINFFTYTFLYHYSNNYFHVHFLFHFLQTILLGITIVGLSIGLSLILKKLTKIKVKGQIEDLSILASRAKIKCPKCGTEFESIPKFCYKCNSELFIKLEEKNTNGK